MKDKALQLDEMRLDALLEFLTRLAELKDSPLESLSCLATCELKYPPLESLTRPTVPTEQAAYYLDRRPQTLRGWACSDGGALRAIRVSGRLAWPVAEIKRVLETA